MLDTLRLFRPAFARRPRRGLLSTLLRLDAAYRDRCKLDSLPPERLRDLGLTKDDVRCELRGSLWDAPDHWLR